LLLKLALAQTAPQALEADLPERSRVLELAARLDAETVQLCYQIALQGRDDLALAPDEHAGFLMTLLRMLVFRPGDSSSPARDEQPVAAKAAAPQQFDGNWTALVQKLPLAGGAKELARNSELKSQANG